MIQWKLGCRSRKQKRENQPIARPGIEHCNWFILSLLLATPTKQFSLDHTKRRSHKQNQCSAYKSVGMIFTGSYPSTLLTTTPKSYDSVASGNQPLQILNGGLGKLVLQAFSVPAKIKRKQQQFVMWSKGVHEEFQPVQKPFHTICRVGEGSCPIPIDLITYNGFPRHLGG